MLNIEEIKKLFKKMKIDLRNEGFDYIRCTMNSRQIEQRTATISFFWESSKETEKDGMERMETLVESEALKNFVEKTGSNYELDKNKDCGIIVWKLRLNY